MSLHAYIQEHRLEQILTDIINQCTKARAKYPLVFMAEHLMKQTTCVITDCKARYVLDSRGLPTTEVDITTAKGVYRATCPASSFQTLSEFREYRDDDPGKYNGRGVMRAVYEINEKIAPLIKGQDARNQSSIDQILVENTTYSNVMYPVSVAIYKAGAPCSSPANHLFPMPVIQVCSTPTFQRLYVIPVCEPSTPSFEECLRMCVEVYHRCVRTCDTVMDGIIQMTKAISNNRYIKIIVDMNASEFLTEDNFYDFDHVKRNRDEMHAMYKKWVNEHPIAYIENPFDSEEAFEPREYYISSHPRHSNHLFCLKPSQYGTVTRILEACRSFGHIMISHRTGDTDDDFECRLAMEIGATYLRLGSIQRFNQLLRTEK
jgi:enolase